MGTHCMIQTCLQFMTILTTPIVERPMSARGDIHNRDRGLSAWSGSGETGAPSIAAYYRPYITTTSI